MKCPVCKAPELLMADRQGIEIDYCATCRGVWLDRGELDKLIERAAVKVIAKNAGAQPVAAATHAGIERRRDERHRYGEHDERDRHDGEYGDRRHPNRKKKSMLGELFDFG
jgi:Zn-finger nucleic acid-binding protein